MNSFAFHETKQHGTLDFPFEYYYVDATHPRYEMPFHWHKEWEIIYIKEGSFTVHADEVTYIAQKGDFLLIRDGMLHSGSPKNCVYECFLFDFHALFSNLDMVKKHLRPIYNQQLLPHIYYAVNQNSELDFIMSKLSNAYSQHNKCAQNTIIPLELIVFGCISQLFALILQEGLYTHNPKNYEENTHKIDLIKTVLEYIEFHYDSPITLEDLAETANMNPKYFCRFFRSITHQTPMDYVNRYRIEKAARMLLDTRLPITNICMECGFNDSSNFIKVFRKYKGMTPKQYRNG